MIYALQDVKLCKVITYNFKNGVIDMLIQFSVTNYMSLKDETILSMDAGAGTELRENLQEYRDGNLLPTVAIYGANAAGKSNIFKAITAAIRIIRDSNERQIDRPLPLINPYAFDDKHRQMPCEFDFIFVTNNAKYQYGFSADYTQIYNEYLYKYNSKLPSLIFERTNTIEYRYTKSNETKLKQYEEKTSANKLFLTTATNWNCELTKEAYMWFANSIDTYNDTSFMMSPYVLETLDKGGESLQSFITSLLKTADINISGYNIDSEIKDTPDELQLSSFPGNLPFPPKMKSYTLNTNHRISTNKDIQEYSLPFDAESEGTKRIFIFAPIIKEALEKGRTIIVDEIDNSLHPLFLEYLINLFNNKETNPNCAQLIFNTHSVEMLSLDLLRRDQIYFVEKHTEDGSTELYSLDEFSPRKTENIRKGYLQGRYGAIPNIGLETLI